MNPTFGFTFQPLADKDGWVSLGNVKIDGMDAYGGDYIYQLSDEDATPNLEQYTYWDLDNVKLGLQDLLEDDWTEEYAKTLVGWWSDFFACLEPDAEDYRLDGVEFAAGSSFIGLIAGCQTLTVNCAGNVQTKPSNVTITGMMCPTFANPVPSEIRLGSIKIPGMNAYAGDYVYQLSKLDATPNLEQYSYWDLDNVKLGLQDLLEDDWTEEYAKTLVGWWSDFFACLEPDAEDYRFDNLPVAPGESFIGLMSAGADEGNTAIVSFPAAY